MRRSTNTSVHRLNGNPFRRSAIARWAAILLCSTPGVERVASGAARTWDGSINTDWHTAGNWAQNAVPGSLDDVLINIPNDDVTLSANTAGVDSLTIRSGADLFTSGFRLLVDDVNVLASTTLFDTGTRIVVEPGNGINDFDSDQLSVLDGARLQLAGGNAEIDRYLGVDGQSEIRGFGLIEAATLDMAGVLNVTGGNLTLQGNANSIFDLDGIFFEGVGDSGTVNVTGGNLTVENAPVADFRGTLNISAGRRLSIETPWALDGGANPGILNLNGGATLGTAAALAGTGALVDLRGAVNVSGVGRISSQVQFQSSASIALMPGAVLVVDGDALLRGGAFTGPGAVRFEGDVTVFDPVAFDAPVVFGGAAIDLLTSTSALTFNASVTYSGTNISGVGTLHQNGDSLVNADSIISVDIYNLDGRTGNAVTTIDRASLTITADAIEVASEGNTFDGTVRIIAGALAVNTPAPWRMNGTILLEQPIQSPQPNVSGADLIVTGGGTIRGNGRFAVNVDNSGVISPGASPGMIEIDGDYRQRAVGDLVIELGGVAPTEFDRLVIDGTAILDGTLSVDLLPSYEPSLGDAFPIIAAGERIGVFSATRFNRGVGDRQVLRTRYSSRGVSLIVTFPGDTDFDGDVDINDLNNVRNNFGGSGSPIAGDTDDDHDVDIGDLNAVRNNFGKRANAPSVPEPNAASLLVIAWAVFGVTIKRRPCAN